jgi:hypothetical protein
VIAPGNFPGRSRVRSFLNRPDQGVVVLGDVAGVVVDGAGVVVEGAGGPALSLRGIDGADCGAGCGPMPTSETSALDGGAEEGAFAGEDAGGAGAAAGPLGWVVFGSGLDAPLAPSVARVRAIMPANPTTKARTHAPMSAARRFRAAALSPSRVPSTTGGVASSAGNDSRTVAGETGTSAAFRNLAGAKRRRVGGRQPARAAACSSWSGP